MPSTNNAAATAWDGPFSPFVNATSSGTAAVCPFQPPGAAAPELWAIWNSTQVDHAGTTGLSYAVGHSSSSRMGWSTGLPLVDTLGNRIQSAYTPSLAVLDNHMHLVVVKPDGRGTLAHYIYLENVGAWEYNTGWVTQPQTTASPSITAFGTSGLLYLAYTSGGTASVCTYTPNPSGGPKYGTWSAPSPTGIPSATNAPALFTAPYTAGPELHLAVVSSAQLVFEYVMGSGITQWTQTTQPPQGGSARGIGACSTAEEAVLAVPGITSSSSLWVITRLKGSQAWPSAWTNTTTLPVAFGNVAPVIFDSHLYCFYINSSNSDYKLVFVTQPLST